MINSISFGAIAFQKPIPGQDNLKAAKEVAKNLGINYGNIIFNTTNATTNGILFKFIQPKFEQEALKKAQAKGIKYVHIDLPNEEVGKRKAKEAMHSLDS